MCRKNELMIKTLQQGPISNTSDMVKEKRNVVVNNRCHIREETC